MAVRELKKKPVCMAHFPDTDGYRWLELSDKAGPYGYAAIRERGEELETHLTLARWGPGVRRQMTSDMDWVKNETKRLGKKRILGVRADADGRFDANLFRFGSLFGFGNFRVLQTMSIQVDK